MKSRAYPFFVLAVCALGAPLLHASDVGKVDDRATTSPRGPNTARLCRLATRPQPGAHSHYATNFEIQPEGAIEETQTKIILLTRDWVASKYAPFRGIKPESFAKGGEWTPSAGITVKSAELRSEKTGTIENWAFVLLEDKKENPKIWETDISINLTPDGKISVYAATFYYSRPEGTNRSKSGRVSSNVPRIVSDILGTFKNQLFSGGVRLAIEPVRLKVGQGMDLVSLIENPKRTLPVIYISNKFRDGHPALDPYRLADRLKGSAYIFIEDGEETFEELKHVMPEAFRVWDGGIRVYQPNTSLSDRTESTRHFFHTRDRILFDPRSVQDSIFANVMRSNSLQKRLVHPDEIRSYSGLEEKLKTIQVARKVAEAIRKLEEHRKKQAAHPALSQLEAKLQAAESMVEVLESVNTSLGQENDTLQNERKRLIAERDDIKVQRDIAELELEERKNEIEHLEDELKAVKKNFVELGTIENLDNVGEKTKVHLGLTEDALVDIFSELPKDTLEVLEKIEKMFAGRIAFTKRAKTAAKQAQHQDPKIPWRMLFGMATVLHDLYFDKEKKAPNLNAVAERFQAQVGFEIAFNETTKTKQNAKMMEQRKDEYDGRTLDFIAHVKYGTKAKCLRVHFNADHKTRTIVISHVGDHLPTVGDLWLH